MISVSDAAFPLFLTASLSFPDPVQDLVRPRKTIRLREAFLLLMGKLRKQPLPCVGEKPVLPIQLFREGSRGRRDPHDGHKDGEAEPGRSREIVLTQLGKTSQEDIDRLLLWSESLPEEVRPSKYEVPKSIVDSIKKDKYE